MYLDMHSCCTNYLTCNTVCNSLCLSYSMLKMHSFWFQFGLRFWSTFNSFDADALLMSSAVSQLCVEFELLFSTRLDLACMQAYCCVSALNGQIAFFTKPRSCIHAGMLVLLLRLFQHGLYRLHGTVFSRSGTVTVHVLKELCVLLLQVLDLAALIQSKQISSVELTHIFQQRLRRSDFACCLVQLPEFMHFLCIVLYSRCILLLCDMLSNEP